jgi:hypothetical protein
MMDPHIWPLEWPDFAPMFVPSQSERAGHGTLDQNAQRWTERRLR